MCLCNILMAPKPDATHCPGEWKRTRYDTSTRAGSIQFRFRSSHCLRSGWCFSSLFSPEKLIHEKSWLFCKTSIIEWWNWANQTFCQMLFFCITVKLLTFFGVVRENLRELRENLKKHDPVLSQRRCCLPARKSSVPGYFQKMWRFQLTSLHNFIPWPMLEFQTFRSEFRFQRCQWW